MTDVHCRCLEEGGAGLLSPSNQRILKRLVGCIFKVSPPCQSVATPPTPPSLPQTLDLQLEMADSPLFSSMPVCLPWKVFHTVLSRYVCPHSSLTCPSSIPLYLFSIWRDKNEVAMETEQSINEDSSPLAMETNEDTSKEVAPGLITADEKPPADVNPATTEDSGLSPVLQYLQEAHLFLGSMGWCCRDDGCLLKVMVEALRRELRVLTALPHKTREVRSTPHTLIPSPSLLPLPSPPLPPLLAQDAAPRFGAMLLLPLWPPSQESKGKGRRREGGKGRLHLAGSPDGPSL